MHILRGNFAKELVSGPIHDRQAGGPRLVVRTWGSYRVFSFHGHGLDSVYPTGVIKRQQYS